MIRIQRILVPMDFSEPAHGALRYAKEFGRCFDASIDVLHVIEEFLIYGGSMPVAPNVYDELERNAVDELKKLLTEEERRQLKVELLIKRGSPFVEIIRHARESEADLVVMGTHGRGPVAHMLMGSVAEKVVRKSPCPVLTVRHPEHEFIMP